MGYSCTRNVLSQLAIMSLMQKLLCLIHQLVLFITLDWLILMVLLSSAICEPMRNQGCCWWAEHLIVQHWCWEDGEECKGLFWSRKEKSVAAFTDNLLILLQRKCLSCASGGFGLQTHLTSEAAGDVVISSDSSHRVCTVTGLKMQWLCLSPLIAFVFQAIPKHN